MRTLHSLTFADPARDTPVVFDYAVGRDDASWYRHDFDRHGRYVSVGRCPAPALRAGASERFPAILVIELRCAAAALEQGASRLLEEAEQAAETGEPEAARRLAARAAQVRRDRLLILREVIAVCEDSWDRAVARVSSARRRDPDALPGAIRSVEMLWTAREAVKRLIRHADEPARHVGGTLGRRDAL